MLSKKSYFNKTLFLKTVCRFWPIWAMYAATWLVALPFVLGSNLRYSLDKSFYVADYLHDLAIYGGVIIGAIAAIASVMAIWSFLYNNRSTHGVAMLPIKREGVFCSVTLAGIVPYIAANVLVFFVTLGVTAMHNSLNITALLTWFAVVTLELIFFYGFAVFCAQLTGNIVVLPLVYAVLNFTAIVVEAIMRMLLSTFIFGMQDTGEYKFAALSPVVKYFQDLSTHTEFNLAGEAISKTFVGWGTVIVYAVIGVVFVAAALVLYRRRRMESSGDVVAVNILKPVFKYCLTLGCALVLGWVFYMLNGGYEGLPNLASMIPLIGFMLMGAFVGYFAALMLIKKSFRVWKKSWAGFGLSALVIVVLMVGMECDLFGYEHYVPKTERIESVTVTGDGNSITLSQSENIELIRMAHKGIIENKKMYEHAAFSRNYGSALEYLSWQNSTFRFIYMLKDGSTVVRRYRLWYDAEDASTTQDVLAVETAANCREAVAARYEQFVPKKGGEVSSITIPSNMNAVECAESLGYSSAEEFILCYYGGYMPADIPFIDPVEKRQLIVDIAMHQAINVDGYKYSEEYYKYAQSFAGAVAGDYSIELYTPEYYQWFEENLVLENLWFQIDATLTPAEANDLYYNCILPDAKDGLIGQVWHVQGEEYFNTVYDSYISVETKWPDENSAVEGDYNYNHNTLKPTVHSIRTVRWLEAHGYELHTIAERMEYSAQVYPSTSFAGE